MARGPADDLKMLIAQTVLSGGVDALLRGDHAIGDRCTVEPMSELEVRILVKVSERHDLVRKFVVKIREEFQ